MKKLILQIFLSLLAVTATQADTALQIPTLYGCLYDFGVNYPLSGPPTVNSTFNLPNVSGLGMFQSQVPNFLQETVPPSSESYYFYTYVYSIDLSGMTSPQSHCVRLVIHFGSPVSCYHPGVGGDPGQIQSATLADFGDITFVFNGGCLSPGQDAVSFVMLSAAGYKTGVVTVIDDYVDPASGLNEEIRINVPALVPDVPPNPPPWVYYHPLNLPAAWFQGMLSYLPGTNGPIPKFPADGSYDFTLQLLALPTNGPAVSQVVTQTVNVANGLFNIPLPGGPVSFADGSVRYLNIGVRPTGSAGGFTPLNPAQPITPTPQAYYAYSAGRVANLAPGQAVTSLNGLTDAVNLEAINGILLTTNRNTLTIGMIPAVVSDRSLKTDFAPVKPEDILARVTALPITDWRYTNDPPAIRHVGPMAQDFRAAFGLGHDEKLIEFVDEQGVSLAAIQGLNHKVEDSSQRSADRIQKLEAEHTALRQALGELSKTVQELKHQLNGGAQ